MGTSLKRIELDLKTPTVRSQEHTPRFKKKLNHHAAQETDGARGRRLARREGGSIAGHENGRVAKPKSGTGRDRIVGRGRRKHATRDPNEWGDDIPLWESHPSRSHATAREKTPRQRRLEKKAERTTKNVRGRKLHEAPKERAIPSQTGQFGHGRTIFVLHVLGERTREECGQAMFHLR